MISRPLKLSLFRSRKTHTPFNRTSYSHRLRQPGRCLFNIRHGLQARHRTREPLLHRIKGGSGGTQHREVNWWNHTPARDTGKGALTGRGAPALFAVQPHLLTKPPRPPKMWSRFHVLALASLLGGADGAPPHARVPRQTNRCSGDWGGDGTCIDACGHYQPSGCWVKTGTKMRLLTLRYLG